MDNSINENWINKLVDELVDAKTQVNRLSVDSAQRDILIEIILNNSRLDYSGEGLRLENESAIFEYLRAIQPYSYEQKLIKLKEDKEAELARVMNEAPIKKEAKK